MRNLQMNFGRPISVGGASAGNNNPLTRELDTLGAKGFTYPYPPIPLPPYLYNYGE